ncbi:hypothetical protein IEQ34_006661 [Dendrobium chrysotoxum]|uniref:RNase H type-1 domain-containing protein n=1 Tax=Dendrobium chrysotoxum TaxID=161865 RepID=A0AAV7GPS2_DENCH|nr:hypothetical protein IEQ34_006661 [Dendrobium chrysotoxum]
MRSILALREVLQDCMFEVKGIIIYGDNFNVMKYVQSMMNNKDVEAAYLKQEDLSFLRDFNQVIFQFLNRSCNKLAICCANFACSSDFIWDDNGCNNIPPYFVSLLKEECDRDYLGLTGLKSISSNLSIFNEDEVPKESLIYKCAPMAVKGHRPPLASGPFDGHHLAFGVAQFSALSFLVSSPPTFGVGNSGIG